MPRPVFGETGHVILRAGTGAQEIWVHLRLRAARLFVDRRPWPCRCAVGRVARRRCRCAGRSGTYLYRRSTLAALLQKHAAHNTLTVDGLDQAEYGGSFLWLSGPMARSEELELLRRAGLSGPARRPTSGWRSGDPSSPHAARSGFAAAPDRGLGSTAPLRIRLPWRFISVRPCESPRRRGRRAELGRRFGQDGAAGLAQLEHPSGRAVAAARLVFPTLRPARTDYRLDRPRHPAARHKADHKDRNRCRMRSSTRSSAGS